MKSWVCDYEICTPIIDKDAYEKYEELRNSTFDIDLVISCIQH